MKKILSVFCLLGFVGNAYAADPVVVVRPAVFSTSADWESVTGLRLRQYKLTFGRDASQGSIGTELYFLDSFPCYGQTDSVFTWVSPSRGFSWDKDAVIRITCLMPPKTLQFAYRAAKKDATQGMTKGIMTCNIDDGSTEIKVRLNECELGKNWKDM